MSMGPPPSRRPSSAPAGRGARRGGFGGAPRGTFDARTLYEVDDGLGGFGRTRYVQRRTAAPAQRISAFGSYVGSHPGRRADKGRGVSSVGFQPDRLIGGGALDGGRDRRTQFALPLHDACWRDDVGRVAALLDRGAAVDARELYGETQAVHVACSANAVRALRLLLDRGADVDALAVDDVTPCHACCGREDASDCLELLLRRGADPTVRDAMATVAPRWLSMVAMPRPSPVPPPVTNATLPSKQPGGSMGPRLGSKVGQTLRSGASPAGASAAQRST